MHGNLRHEMWRDGSLVMFRQGGLFEPSRQPAQTSYIRLHDINGTALKIAHKLLTGKERFAHGDGDLEFVGQTGMSFDVLARNWFLEPVSADFLLKEVTHRESGREIVTLVS